MVGGGGGSVLQLSMRRIHDLVAFCLPYEFEDVVAEVTSADRVEPENYQTLEFARRLYKLGRLATRSRRLARGLVPRLGVPRLSRDYDLFFPVFNHAFELFSLLAVPDWRERCRVAACFISEIWTHEIPEYLLELLARFDHVFLGVRHPIEMVARIAGRPCTYLPLAVDVLRFAPYPNQPARAIDVCNIGRRSPVTHAALLRLARDRRIFYYYDTVRAIRRDNVHQAALRHDWVHRLHTVFDTLGLRPTEAMLAREERLRSLAALVLEARGAA